MIFRRLSPLLGVALLLASGAALAEPSEADRAKARALANEGYDALDKKDYPTAADRFAKADSLFHVASVALGLARAQAGLGKLVEAEGTYRRIVHEGIAPGAAAPLVKALADAGHELDALSPQVPGVILAVRGGGAPKVTLDGAAISADALGVRLPVNPGEHVIRASASGYRAFSVSVTVPRGKNVTVPIEMRPESSAPEPTAPVPPEDPSHASPPWPAQKIAGTVLMAASAAGAVAGGVLAAQAHSKFSDLSGKCPTRTNCDPSLGPELDSYHAASTASVASFVAGGAVLATGLVVFLTAPKAKGKPEAFVVPRVGVGYLGIEGRFR